MTAPIPATSSTAASIPTARGGSPRSILPRHDDGELYLQYSASEAFGFDDGRLKTADYHSASGFGLRGVTGETTAFAHANEISEAAIERAAATLKLLDPAKGAPAPPPQRTNQAMYGADDPLSLVPVRREGRAVPADRRRGARPRPARRAGQRQPRGELERDRHRPRRRLRRLRRPPAGPPRRADRRRAERPARDRLSRPWRPLSLRRSCSRKREWNRAIDDRARARRWSTSNSVAAPAGEMPVVLGPGWPGVLLHEAVGHGLEGDFNRKGTSAFSGRHRRARRGARSHGGRRRRDGPAARLADHRRRRHADAAARC